jgi:N-methylhydantoinase B
MSAASTADPVTLEVLNHRFGSIAEEMQLVLLRTAFSTIVKEARDCAAAVFDARGQTVAQACGMPILLGVLTASVPEILEEFPVTRMQEGDVFLMNHPYRGGTHLPDLTVLVPVVESGDVVAFTCTMAHSQDIGGATPGSIPVNATEIFQEGLILPPVQLYRAGEPNKAVFDILASNTRLPQAVLGDLGAQVAAATTGRIRVLELFGRHGRDAILAAMAELQDYAEALCRRAVARIPDGRYAFTDFSDSDGIDRDRRITVAATVTVQGSDVTIDFTGTSAQTKGPINCTPSNLIAVACYTVRAVCGGAIPNNAGAFRPIRLVLPRGTLVNPDMPGAVSNRGVTYHRAVDAVLGALVRCLPDRLPAAALSSPTMVTVGGTDPETGRAYVVPVISVGGMGARPTRDGVDAVSTHLTNVMNTPVEAAEMNFPVRFLERALAPDSGGAGEYRGGLGEQIVVEVLRGDAVACYLGERHTTRAWGVRGGQAGAASRAAVLRRAGPEEELPGSAVVTLRAGDRLTVRRGGGGGYGDPLRRPGARVRQDVRDGRISLERAAADYGVIVDATTLELDAEGTRRRRADLAEARGAVSWLFDRGPGLGRE